MIYPQLQDADWLRDQYLTQDKTPTEIRAAVGCSISSVYDALSRAGIRPKGRRGSVRRHVHTPEQLYDAYRNAGSAKAAAAALGMSVALYRRRCQEVGVDPGAEIDANRRAAAAARSIPRPTKAQLVDLYLTHGTWVAVADALGVSVASLRSWVTQAGIMQVFRRTRRVTIIEMRRRGLSIDEIGRALGLAPSTVWRQLQRAVEDDPGLADLAAAKRTAREVAG